jgi:hypothetical protein
MVSFQAQSSRLCRQKADHASLGARLSIGFTTDNLSQARANHCGIAGMTNGKEFKLFGINKKWEHLLQAQRHRTLTIALIKVTDNGPLSATAKYLSDGLGNDSALALSTARVGIGTASPSVNLHIFGGSAAIKVHSTTNESYLNYENSTTTASIKVTNNDLATILGGSERMRITSAGNVGIGTNSPLVKLEVKGSGSTSATTSLLVQNSAGSLLLRAKDDGQVQLGSSSNFTVDGNTTYNRYELTVGGLSSIPSAILSATSTTRGFLPPRMTTTQRDAIATPATGLKVYNTTTNTTDTYDGATWQRFGQQTLIKGSGSTSATTSLLVQNSAGSMLLQIKDDRIFSTSGGNGLIGKDGALYIGSNFITTYTVQSVGFFGANVASAIVEMRSTTKDSSHPE